MVGQKGKSGRKPRDDGLKARPVALYIDHMAFQEGPKGRTHYVAVSWFQQFKRIYGSRWQEKTRTMIQHQVRKDQAERMWMCGCSGIMRYHFKTEPKCHACDQWHNEHTRRIHDPKYTLRKD
jgi:hypothetical protein